jgi:two-component system, NarL family, invasion response regulator UvrY
MLKILMIDDHPIVRSGLKQILSESRDLLVTGEAGTGEEALEKFRHDSYDMVLLDISLPDTNGLDVLAKMKKNRPLVPVLILSVYPEEQYAVRALKSGASGYLSKLSAPEELMKAIKKISEGGNYISQALAECLATDIIHGNRPLHESLSEREFQVACMIAQGKSVKEIASTLSISEKTVSTYRSRVLEKMKMDNNAQLIRYAIQNRMAS